MMKKMKYFLLLCLIVSTVGAFTACGNDKDVADTSMVENTNNGNNGSNSNNDNNNNDNNNNDGDSMMDDIGDAGKDIIDGAGDAVDGRYCPKNQSTGFSMYPSHIQR